VATCTLYAVMSVIAVISSVVYGFHNFRQMRLLLCFIDWWCQH